MRRDTTSYRSSLPWRVYDVVAEWPDRRIHEHQMGDVLLRHHPELRATLRGVENAFAPWRRTGSPE